MSGLNRFAEILIGGNATAYLEYRRNVVSTIVRYGRGCHTYYSDVTPASEVRLRRVIEQNDFIRVEDSWSEIYHWQPQVRKEPTMDELNYYFSNEPMRGYKVKDDEEYNDEA